MYNASERKDIRKAQKESRQEEVARGEVIRQVCSTEPGRTWLWGRLSFAGIFDATFISDALAMAYRQGERNQGLQLLNDIMVWCPEQYILMMREANVRATIRELPGDQNTGGGDSPDSTDLGDPAEPTDDPGNSNLL